jgi:cytochrome c oxidase subunit 2
MSYFKTILLGGLMGAALAASPVSASAPAGTAGPALASATTPPTGDATQTPPAADVATVPTGAATAAAGAEPAAKPAAAAATPQFYKPTPGIGQPDGGIHIQPQVTKIGQDAEWMHDVVLMPIITVICLFVLGLLLWVMAVYRRREGRAPSRTSHNTFIEIIWTLVPVLILVVIAVPSIKLLAAQYAPPKADLTVKVIGHQWYWSYQYPDNGDFEIVSNILKEDESAKRGEPRLLGVDERLVVPVGAVVKLIVTSDDVIHSFAVPAFWTKMDAVPGRLNETWFKAERPGLYYGQCSELCGARHAYMPIAVEVVSQAQFAQWVAAKGGTIGAKPTSSDATGATPSATATADPDPIATTAPAVDGAAVAKPTTQGATANQGSNP